MGYLDWECRLYGHEWHHPWTHEVVVTTDTVPVYPLECRRCADVRLLDRTGERWRPDEADGPSVHERALEFETRRE